VIYDDVLTLAGVKHSPETEEALRRAITLHLLRWAGTVVALHHARADHAGASRERASPETASEAPRPGLDASRRQGLILGVINRS
jgi:hypothetical protein